jgi:hypothetical protein
MPLVSRTILSTSSYAPLFALLSLVSWHGHPWLAVAFLCIAGSLVIALASLFLYLSRRLGEWLMEIGEAEGKTEELGAYTATYLLPFLAFAFDRWETVLALFLVIALLSAIYVRARLPYLNPLLLFFGYRLVEVHHRAGGSDSGDPYRISIAIVHRDLRQGDYVKAAYLQRPRTDIGVLLIKSIEPRLA